MDSAPNLLISSTDSFRYDINALLAIAVIAVVLFHFQVPGFSGGSVGVDIFFVISGFLMTSIIVTGLQTQHDGGKSFSLSNFNKDGSSYYSWYWEQTMRALTQAGYRAIAVDRLGWGKSSKPLIPYDVSLHASNINAILEHLGIAQVVIAGHSLGGRLASNFAHLYPEKATHLIMVNPIALNDSASGRAWSQPTSGSPEPDLQAHYAANLRQEQNRIVDWKPEYMEHVRIRYGHALSGDFHRLNLVRAMNNRLTAEPVDTYWSKINIPALLIGGAEDGPNYPDTSRRAVDLLPNGQLIMLPGVGHNPHLEAPEQLNREIMRFLDGGS